MRVCTQHPFKAGVAASPSCRRRVVARHYTLAVKATSGSQPQPLNTCARALSTLIAAGVLSLSPPCEAQIQTVPSANVTSYAKPIPKAEKVPKGTVWILFVGGAAALFGTVLAVENYAGWFPAIARANQAIKENKMVFDEPEVYTPEPRPPRQVSTPNDIPPPSSSTDAVLAGLAEARAKVLASETTSSSLPSTDSASSMAHATTSSTSDAGSANDAASGTANGAAATSSSSDSSSGGGGMNADDRQWEKQRGEDMRNASQLIGMSDQQLEKYVEARKALEEFKEQSVALKEQRGSGQVQPGALKE